MKWSFQARIRRANQLAQSHEPARELLGFYRELACLQAKVFEDVRSRGETNVRAIAEYFPELIDVVARAGPDGLAQRGRERLTDRQAREQLMQFSWESAPAHAPAADPIGRFFSRVLLQPYAEYLASRGDVQVEPEGRTCPFCGSRPVAGVLRGEGDGGKRWLLCSVCSTEWPFRRVLCWNCGEEDKDKLPIYSAPEFPAVRVDACDTCRTYLKSVDLTKDGHAVPMVDEIATVALDIWAEEHGYGKMQENLLGA
jgi:FdhE protein